MRKSENMPYHHGNLRNALVDAAISVLSTKGVVGLSLRGLASELGVSHGAPNRHFRNKAELLEAVAVGGYERLSRICLDAQKKNPDDPKKQLYEAGLGYLVYVANNPEIADLMFGRLIPLETGGQTMHQAANNAINSLAAIIENGKQSGLYGSRDTMDLVLTALSTVHGLSMFVSSGMIKNEADSEEGLKQLASKVYEIVMYGMLARENY